jgi:deazaflavin-dependent oxidoreductase (nitroreductase family)
MKASTVKRPGAIARRMMRTFNGLHVFLYRRGIGRHFPAGPVVLLTTTGRKSGRPITSPIMSVRDPEGFIVIASAGGADWHPSWWLNLKANPRAVVEDGNQKIPVRAVEVTEPAAKDRLWKKMTAVYKGYDGYTRKTDRVIPLGLLKPVS